MLYEVAIIEVPSKKEAESGVEPAIVLPPTAVLADNENLATAKAVAQAGVTPDRLGKVEVLVRPFA